MRELLIVLGLRGGKGHTAVIAAAAPGSALPCMFATTAAAIQQWASGVSCWLQNNMGSSTKVNIGRQLKPALYGRMMMSSPCRRSLI